MKTIGKREDGSTRVVISFIGEEDKARQDGKNEADINFIMKKYKKTGN